MQPWRNDAVSFLEVSGRGIGWSLRAREHGLVSSEPGFGQKLVEVQRALFKKVPPLKTE